MNGKETAEVERETHVTKAMSFLDAEVVELARLIEMLEERFSRVLTPKSEAPTTQKDPVACGSVPLAHQIESMGNGIQESNEKLRGLIQRTEL